MLFFDVSSANARGGFKKPTWKKIVSVGFFCNINKFIVFWGNSARKKCQSKYWKVSVDTRHGFLNKKFSEKTYSVKIGKPKKCKCFRIKN